VLSVTFLVSCASRPLLINTDSLIETLGICVNFNEHIHGDEKLLYLNAAKDLVDEHQHNKKGEYVLDTCKQGQQNQLNILVQNTNFVDPPEQAVYVLLSTVGILYPLNGGGIGFFWLGFNNTSVELTLSEKLAGTNKPVYRQVYSSPYFMDSESVRISHMESFKGMILESVQELQLQQKDNIEPQTLGEI